MAKRVNFNPNVEIKYIPPEDRHDWHYIDSIRARLHRERLILELSARLNAASNMVVPGRSYTLGERTNEIKTLNKRPAQAYFNRPDSSSSEELPGSSVSIQTETNYEWTPAIRHVRPIEISDSDNDSDNNDSDNNDSDSDSDYEVIPEPTNEDAAINNLFDEANQDDSGDSGYDFTDEEDGYEEDEDSDSDFEIIFRDDGSMGHTAF